MPAVIGGVILRKTLTEVFLSNANPYTYAHDGDDIILSVVWTAPWVNALAGEAPSGSVVRFNGVVIAKEECRELVGGGNAQGHGNGKAIIPLISVAAGNYVIDSVASGPRGAASAITTNKYVRS